MYDFRGPDDTMAKASVVAAGNSPTSIVVDIRNLRLEYCTRNIHSFCGPAGCMLVAEHLSSTATLTCMTAPSSAWSRLAVGWPR